MNTTYVETNQQAIQIGQPFKGGGQLQDVKIINISFKTALYTKPCMFTKFFCLIL